MYSQYRELQSFAQFGSDLDADTKSRLALGERIVEVLKQGKNHPVRVGCQVAIVYAVIKGYLNSVAVKDVEKLNLLALIPVAIIGSLVSVVGDIFASAIKRFYKIKDYGKIMPGHGGVLDRFDSMLMVTAYMSMIMQIFSLVK